MPRPGDIVDRVVSGTVDTKVLIDNLGILVFGFEPQSGEVYSIQLVYSLSCSWVWLWCSTPLSTIFIYRGGQLY
jgi:hypothetical protein